jgi:hypothetical protein
LRGPDIEQALAGGDPWGREIAGAAVLFLRIYTHPLPASIIERVV